MNTTPYNDDDADIADLINKGYSAPEASEPFVEKLRAEISTRNILLSFFIPAGTNRLHASGILSVTSRASLLTSAPASIAFLFLT